MKYYSVYLLIKFPFSFLVDESLLHTPEDEIDFAKVALKDIILFADYKEQLVVHIMFFKSYHTSPNQSKTFSIRKSFILSLLIHSFCRFPDLNLSYYAEERCENIKNTFDQSKVHESSI